jgi:hypothetical protein
MTTMIEKIMNRPTQPGYYWAKMTSLAEGAAEDNLDPSGNWEVVEVWENFIGPTCEADEDEKFGVSVPGMRETQWLENFQWGQGPLVNPGTILVDPK